MDADDSGLLPGGIVSLRNRCGESKSPYVRAHASNATAWQLWNAETLALARRLNRMLFVSIGYSACHWCHVMAHESFADARIAQLLNERFVPVKLDREERPDIDRQYMDFLQATSGSGGWPLNVFVTPDLEPIFGGTYWPGPGSDRSRLGGVTFEQILVRVADAWKEQESRCRENGKQIVRQLREFAQEGNLGSSQTGGSAGSDAAEQQDGLELDLLEESYTHWKGRFDGQYGGFGGAPKFPTPMHLRHLLRLGSYGPEVREVVGEQECQHARAMTYQTLESMARGGIKDQVGHGFARYSVARDWSLPHFEKMLYDNTQLLPLYLDAYLVSKNPLFLAMTDDIAAYLTSSPMVSSLGGIHASEDADSLPTASDKHTREGAFYVWTFDELKGLLSEEELLVSAKYWGVEAAGNIEARFDAEGELAGQNTLCVQHASLDDLASQLALPIESVTSAIASSRAKLLAHRDANRPRPALDDKLVTSWNGLAISALSRAGAALSNPKYISAALAAASCVQKHLYDSTKQTLRRVYREGPGEDVAFADDYAFLIAGLLDLYEATADDSHLQWAELLQQKQLQLFWDDANAAFFSTPANQADILIRSKDGMDNAEPSTNGVSVSNLFRLASLLDEAAYATKARQTLAAFEVEMGTHAGLFSGMMEGVVAARCGMRALMVVGEGAAAEAALRAARERVRPGWTVLRVGGKEAKDGWVRERNGLLKGLDVGRELIQVCEGTSCRIVGKEEIDGLFL